jgi:uncharacterized protein YpmB
MDKTLEAAIIAILVVIVIVAIWYFFFRKQKCSKTADCPAGEACGSDGYCHKVSS